MKPASANLAAATLLKLSPLRPTLAIVLGSGFDCPLGIRSRSRRHSLRENSGYLSVKVPRHSGTVVIGKLAGEPVLLLRGRTHSMEGHPMSSVTFAVAVACAQYGIRDLLLTNAAGGINSNVPLGRVHGDTKIILILWERILCAGHWSRVMSSFVDLSRLSQSGDATVAQKKLPRPPVLTLREGIYAAVSGPSYETPAEIKAFRRWAQIAVGMSTVSGSDRGSSVRHAGRRAFVYHQPRRRPRHKPPLPS
jgi:purine-nucleoside phosphorylase